MVESEREVEKLMAQIGEVEAQIARLEAQKKLMQKGKKGDKFTQAKIDSEISNKKKLKEIKHLQKSHIQKSGPHQNIRHPMQSSGLEDGKPDERSHAVTPKSASKSKSAFDKPKSFAHLLYFFLANFASKAQKRSLRIQLSYAGVEEIAEIWLGQILLLSILVGFASFMCVWILFGEGYLWSLIFYFVLGMAAVIGFGIIHLNVKIDERRKRLEEVLPETMQVIAANLRAGMTPVVALRAAARPEFGPLEEDIKFATTKSLGTDSFLDALNEMGAKTNSELFRRIVALFTASLRSGGHLALLLENTAADIRQTQEMKKELISSTRMYALFILFTVAVGTPLLLAVSIQFSGMVSSLQGSTSMGGGIAGELSSIPLIGSPLTVEFLETSAIVVLVMTAILAAAMLGVITDGSYSSGLKYAPFICGFSILLFIFLKDYGFKAILPIG